MLQWRKNLPLRKGGLVADAADGTRYWIHRHTGAIHGIDRGVERTVYRLVYRLPSGEFYKDDYVFRRQKYAKACAERIEKERSAA